MGDSHIYFTLLNEQKLRARDGCRNPNHFSHAHALDLLQIADSSDVPACGNNEIPGLRVEKAASQVCSGSYSDCSQVCELITSANLHPSS